MLSSFKIESRSRVKILVEATFIPQGTNKRQNSSLLKLWGIASEYFDLHRQPVSEKQFLNSNQLCTPKN